MISPHYNAIRPLLKTGDVIGIPTGNRITQTFQRMFNKSDYGYITHVGILVWRHDRLMVAEMDGRYNVERPLSQYINQNVYIFRPCADINPDLMRQVIDLHLSTAIHYDVMDFIAVGLRTIFGKLINYHPERIICTEFVAKILRYYNPDRFPYPHILTPAEMCDSIAPIVYVIENGEI